MLSALLVGGGWGLSALHQLNRAGYAVLLFPMVVLAGFWWKKKRPFSEENFRRLRAKISRRFRRRAPQLFLVIAGLALLSGCLYSALNYDANSYRLPRVMHWLWAGQWHWIRTFDPRMNVAACGMEWLSAPLIAFSHTDRLLFLPNWFSYLLLPGLIFSVFTRLQVRPRVAWWWMWLLSAGWCYALQASSVANDSFAAIYILAAVDLALRAREKNSASDLWLSLLAAALATGTKQTNIPLALLWLVAAWPSRRLLWLRPIGSFLVMGCGLLVSIVPISLLNILHTGSWLPMANNGIAKLGEFHLNPFWGIVGNAFCIPVQNLVPPFYEVIPPFYTYWMWLWNEMMTRFAHTSFGSHFSSFENFGHLSAVYYHGIAEGNAGLGLGLMLLILFSFREIHRLRKNSPPSAAIPRHPTLWLLRLTPWLLLLLFMAKVGAFENARHLAAYYVLLLPAFLIQPIQSLIVRQRDWQRLGLLGMSVTVALVIASGDRPLFPAHQIFAALHTKYPDNEFISEQCGRYVYGPFRINQGHRDFLTASVPADESPIGYYALMYDVDEPGIWLPYGRRAAICVLPDDSADDLRAQGIKHLVVNGNVLRHLNLADWAKQYNATLVDQYTFTRPNSLTTDLYLFRLN